MYDSNHRELLENLNVSTQFLPRISIHGIELFRVSNRYTVVTLETFGSVKTSRALTPSRNLVVMRSFFGAPNHGGVRPEDACYKAVVSGGLARSRAAQASLM